MSLYIDKKYISLLAPKLDKFRQKSEYLWNFRCPVCGDSQKNKLKMRGYIYRRKSDLFFTCHNCGTGHSFGNLLKMVDRSLYSQYQMERFKNESAGNTAKPDFSMLMEKPVFNTQKKINLPNIESLPITHAARHYVKDRFIPKERWSDLYYAEDFDLFVKDIFPEYDKKLYAEPRLVIPFYDEKNILLGFQGRALVNSKVKYITIKLSDDNLKVYGLDRVDKTKKIYVVEGPIDSMFLQNSLAMMDASLYNVISTVGNYDYTFVFDNEPRNKDVCKHMQKAITMGKSVCIWPKHITVKDINEMILKGTSPAMIQGIIDSNTFSLLKAQLEFGSWSKT
ncbi:DNA primase [uncultured Caudovirales phage]|uniref:DNA primase n=3 Tax=uncultured Caudovirales phage TaxID=2100421 RepID=A0A6J5REF2_9CAUD|nr:DNA primase [uncultured Caudovirales phage]CAB4182186.1 DNA primase [uncultured Caudovirales phage]CAB4190795.1 DNA primase [uncultured Caudovirales phage]CAB4211144.1 DNA primase [uncultured Caudovirales phage]CAB4222405.1 DNA primase [uncultured Caudovirales phage]